MVKLCLVVVAAFLSIPAMMGQQPLTENTSEAVIPYEYIPDADYHEVGDRLSCLATDIPLHYNETVYSFITYFAQRNRPYSHMVRQRQSLYFPLFEQYLKQYGLPTELKYLAIVESGLNPRAISRAGAGGLWQFMPGTGRVYKLHQDFYIDQRLDPARATEAACKYLKQLHRQFNDWELALAAYNAGPGNVRKAIRRSGYKKTFWEVYKYLPRETRSYLPQFVAITYLMHYADYHNFNQLRHEALPQADTVVVSQFLHLNTFAQLLGTCEDDLVRLNPAIKRGALPESITNYPLLIPAHLADTLDKHRAMILDSASRAGKKEIEYLARNTVGSTWGREKRVHKVRSGEVLGTIANRYRVRVADIRKWNRIRGNLIRVGQRLAIWVYPGTKEKAPTTTVAKSKPAPKPVALPPNARIYLVQPGDTLWDISRDLGLSVEQIKKLNNLKSNKIKPGQKLVLG